MTIDDKIRDEKLQYDINREASKISALSSAKIDKYEHLMSEEILPSGSSEILQQASFTYSPLKNTLETKAKTIEGQGEKQIKAIENKGEKQLLDTDQKLITGWFSKHFLSKEAVYD